MKTKRLNEDLRILLDYLWYDESKHYQGGSARNHIFLVMKRLAKEIQFQPQREF